jgi:CRISPR-associated exonuclease Cas4
MISLTLGLTLLLFAIVLFIISARQRRSLGLPGGRVVYTDTRTWGVVEKPFFDPELGLTGKPDYLVEQDGRFIPVEVKTGRTPAAPYDAHIFQVAVYCLLVQKESGTRPPYGLIHYPNRDFAVDYTPALETALLTLLAGIRRDEGRSNVQRSHDDVQRCHRCGFRHACDQKLA